MDVLPISQIHFLMIVRISTFFSFKEPPGTSDQIQAPDLGIFGVQKTLKRSINPPEEIIRIIDSWRRATTHSNVTSAFRQAGFYQEIHEDPYIMRADIKFPRGVRGIPHKETHIITGYNKTIRTQRY